MNPNDLFLYGSVACAGFILGGMILFIGGMLKNSIQTKRPKTKKKKK